MTTRRACSLGMTNGNRAPKDAGQVSDDRRIGVDILDTLTGAGRSRLWLITSTCRFSRTGRGRARQ